VRFPLDRPTEIRRSRGLDSEKLVTRGDAIDTEPGTRGEASNQRIEQEAQEPAGDRIAGGQPLVNDPPEGVVDGVQTLDPDHREAMTADEQAQTVLRVALVVFRIEVLRLQEWHCQVKVPPWLEHPPELRNDGLRVGHMLEDGITEDGIEEPVRTGYLVERGKDMDVLVVPAARDILIGDHALHQVIDLTTPGASIQYPPLETHAILSYLFLQCGPDDRRLIERKSRPETPGTEPPQQSRRKREDLLHRGKPQGVHAFRETGRPGMERHHTKR
jgi:hypothetical protein